MQSNFKVGDKIQVTETCGDNKPGVTYTVELWMGALYAPTSEGRGCQCYGNWVLVSSANQTMAQFIYNTGDEIWPIKGREAMNNGCGILRDNLSNVDKIIVRENVENGSRIRDWQALDKNGNNVVTSCCYLQSEFFEKVTSANKAMANLTILTPEQEAGLSTEDKALRELGLINDNLTVNSAGLDYTTRFLFVQNKKAIAQQAAKEVAAIKAEAAKTKEAGE